MGFSLDFAEHRGYEPGDDLRRVDWRVFARTDRYYVKQFEADTNANCVVALDVSKSMRFGTGPISKLDYGRFLRRRAGAAPSGAARAGRWGQLAMSRGGREIEFTSGADRLRGYLALPPRGSGPGVLVLQEWWGLVDHIRDVCDRLARAGFVALAPDLYRAATASDPDAAGLLMMDLAIPRAAADLDAAAAALLGESAVAGGTLGVVGFCMGGQLALLAGTRTRRIGAVVDCYGIHPNVTLDLAGLAAPVLGVFAERDAFGPPAAGRKLGAELRAAGKRTDFEIFPGVDHAFLNETRPDVYDAATAERAWGEDENKNVWLLD